MYKLKWIDIVSILVVVGLLHTAILADGIPSCDGTSKKTEASYKKSYSLHQFVSLETEVWDALVSGDAETDIRLLADEFLGVYSTGFAGRSDHVDQLKAGPVVEWYKLSEARIRVLAEGVVLLSYKAEFIRHKARGAGARETMFVTSIWQSRSGSWKNVFSQDTPAK